MKGFLTSASCAALALGMAAPVAAQEGTVQAEEGLGDIVVTAQRRTERLQNVAISATALDGAALAQKAVTNLADLQTATPALSVSNGGIIQNVNIRGIGLSSDSPNVTAHNTGEPAPYPVRSARLN